MFFEVVINTVLMACFVIYEVFNIFCERFSMNF